MGNPSTNEDLSAYLDGELTDAEVAELEAELARDPELRAELEGLESVVQFLREEGPDMAPMGFHHKVMARVEQENPERPPMWAWLRRPLGFPLEGWLVALAAAAVLLLVLPNATTTSDPGTDGWVKPPPEQPGSPAAVEMPDLEAPTPVAPQKPDPVQKTAPEQQKVAETKPTGKPAPQPVAQQQGDADPVEPVAAVQAAPETLEQTGTDAGNTGGMAAPGYRYVVRGTDPGMKLALLRLAGRYGGAVDAQGEEVADSTMTSSVEQLLVQVSQSDLNRFTKELADLGYTLEKEPTSELVAGTTIPVRITLQLVGGAAEGEDTPPNAARKAMDFEAEMVDEAQSL